MVEIRFRWGLKRIYYYNANRKLESFPLSWTSLQDLDPFIICAEGRSHFRIQDLIELTSIFEERLAEKEREDV